MNYNILIGGQAGQGMATIGLMLQKILQNKGYYVFATNDYMSRVRGGHNFVQIRFSTKEITSHSPNLDVIIALDQKTIDLHTKRLNENGIIICDEDLHSQYINTKYIPMRKIAKDIKNSKVFGSVAIGSLLKLFGISIVNTKNVFKRKFDDKTSEDNYKALGMGANLVERHFSIDNGTNFDSILINGNQAIALGALAAGTSFYSAYPMTPATSIMTYLSKKQIEANIIVEQAEDEIAAINMAIGASYAGVRAMTGTSGGGLSLMVEGFGLSAITEIPLVVVNVQRPGPATGLPTRTAQSDLSFVLSASQDEFPRMVISVRNPEDAFYQTIRAHNLAEKYQILVMILSDQYLSDYNMTIKPYDFNRITINRYLSSKDEINEGKYKRYALNNDGISPRIIPGMYKDKTLLADSHEHNEYGFVDESAENRIKMMEKRMNKLKLLENDLIEPNYIGPNNPELLLLSWGSTEGAIKESMNMLGSDNIRVGALIFGDLFPLPKEKLKKYSKLAKTIVNVEHNYTGQLRRLIRQETGINCDKSILKYDGRQLNGLELYKRIKEEVL